MQGQFTKEEVNIAAEAAREIFNALRTIQQREQAHNLSEIMIFLAAARRYAPTEAQHAAGIRAVNPQPIPKKGWLERLIKGAH